MRRGLLGSIAAVAAGVSTAWGQAPVPDPVGVPVGAPLGETVPAPSQPGPGVAGPNPVLMPPLTVGPPGDPLGLGPTATLGPPPGPMWPPPGPYTAPLFQPAPPLPYGNGGYGSAPRFWFDGSYLLAFVTDQPIGFPLLTTSAPNQNGLLGLPSTLELIRGENIKYSSISGFRLNGGIFGDADKRFGFETGGIYTEQRSVTRRFSAVADDPFVSAGIPLFARPFIDTTSGISSLVISSPDLGPGEAYLSTSTQLWGAHAGGVWNLYRSAPGSKWSTFLDVSAGYRFLQLYEDFQFQSYTSFDRFRVIPVFQRGPFGDLIQVGFRLLPLRQNIGGVTTESPATVSIRDRFTATNRFNGGYFATQGSLRYGMFSLNLMSRVSIGNMHQVLEIHGATNFAQPSLPLNTIVPRNQAGSAFGGLYANATNIGKFDNDEFAVIPEFSVDLGINITRSVSMYVGYNFLYVNKVARPGNQLNPFIDSTTIPFSDNYGVLGRVPGRTRLFVQDDFWLHAANFGMRIKY